MDKNFQNLKPSEIVGAGKLGVFAAFYRDNAEELQNIRDALILQEAKSGEIRSADNFNGVLRGLLSFNVFFNQCDAEVRAMQTEHQTGEQSVAL